MRNPKADPKVLKEIKDIKEKFDKKILEKEKSEIEKQLAVEKQKYKLRKQLEKRSLEQGVATFNQLDFRTNLIFEEGSREKELLNEKKHGLTEIEPIIIELEENCYKDVLENFTRKYHQILKYMFLKYSNSG